MIKQPITKTEEAVVKAQDSKRGVNLLNRVGYLVIVTAALLSFWFFWKVLFPPKILELKSDHLKVSASEVAAGETISFALDYCKHKQIPSNIIISFVDGQLVNSFATVRNLPIGCHTEQLHINVPLNMNPDEYHLEIEITYKGGFFRDEVHQLMTDTFKVLPAKENPQAILIQECVDAGLRSSQALELTPLPLNNPTQTGNTNTTQQNNVDNQNGGSGDEPEPSLVDRTVNTLQNIGNMILPGNPL